MTPPQAKHDRTHEDLLHAHLAGDVCADDPMLTDRLGRCAACRARLHELSDLTGLLDRLGEEQRASLRPDPSSVAPGTERVAATLHALAAGGEGAPASRGLPTRRLTLWRVALAAASVLAAGWIVKVLLPPAEEPREDVLLGEGRRSTATPRGAVESFARFDWPERPPDAQHFRLRVWCTDGPAPVSVVDKTIHEFPWMPTPAQEAAMGQSIAWEIIPFDAAGVELGLERGEATIRS